MPFVFVEWICQKCRGAHRIRYNLLVESPAFHRIRRKIYEKNHVKIDDPAFSLKHARTLKEREKSVSKTRCYGIFVDSETNVQTIIETVREYINLYYTPEKATLKVDVCLDS